MDSFLTVLTRSKGKQSLSCGDLSAIDSLSEYDHHSKRHSLRDTFFPTLKPRFPRSMNRTISRSSDELATDFDCQLAEIREKLAMFREQDIKFRKRMDSLGNSISELASRSSLNSLTPSETSTASNCDDLMIFKDNTNEESYYKEEQTSIMSSFSSEVLNCIPTIEITNECYKRGLERRRSSDPTMHEAARLLKSSMAEPQRHSMYSLDRAYSYSSEGIDNL